MTRRSLLIVLNPRRIWPCLDSIQALNVDRLWLRNMAEQTIEAEWESVSARLDGYDRAFIISDDSIVSQHALDAVNSLLNDGHPVATGYCNLSENDLRVNLCPAPYPDTHVWRTLGEVQAWPTAAVPTSFAGFSLTGMSTAMWERYPYRTVPGGVGGADFRLCQRLHDDAVPIVAHRAAFTWHVKKDWNTGDTTPGRQLLVGVDPPSIELEKCA